MDKQTTLGFVLIGLVLIVWMWIQAPPPQQTKPPAIDTLQTSQPIKHEEKPASKPIATTPVEAPSRSDSLGKYFSPLSRGDDKIFIVKTDLYTAEITTRGGLVRKWELRDYKTWDQHPIQLVEFNKGGDFSLLFTSSDGKLINTRRLYFKSDLANWTTITLTDTQSYTLELVLPLGNGKNITKEYVFKNGTYSFDAKFLLNNVQDIISNLDRCF